MPYLTFKSNKCMPRCETILVGCKLQGKVIFYWAILGYLNHTKYKCTPSSEYSRCQQPEDGAQVVLVSSPHFFM